MSEDSRLIDREITFDSK